MAKAQEAPYEHCLNCGQELAASDNFCRQCGQKRVPRKLFLRDFLQESLSSFFALDGRVFRTLKALFFNPGVLAQDFVNGKRAQYFNPVRVYFLSSLLMLFVVNWNNSEPMVIVNPQVETKADSLWRTETAIEARLDSLPQIYDLSDASWTDKVEVFQEILSLRPNYSAQEAIDRLGLPSTAQNRFWFRQAWKLQQIDKDDFQEKFQHSFQSKLLWILFLMVPFLALVLKLLYWRKKMFYLAHLSLVFYQQSLLFLLITIGNILPSRSDIIGISAALLALVHQFIALRRFYGQKVGLTLFKLLLYLLLGIVIVGLGFLISAAFVFLML